MIRATPGQSIESTTTGAPTGLVGTIGVRIVDGVGGTTLARSTSGIVESPASSGIYTATLTAPTTAGTYVIVWDTGGGTPEWAADDLLVAYTAASDAAPSGDDLCTLADVRLALELADAATERDDLIAALVTDASRVIARACQRQFAPQTALTKRFMWERPALARSTWQIIPWNAESVVDLAPYDLRTVTSITFHPGTASEFTLATGDYLLEPVTPQDGVYTRIRLRRGLNIGVALSAYDFGVVLIDINGDWGFAAVPDVIKRATIITVMSWLRRDVAEFGFNDSAPPGIAPMASPVYAIPPAAWRLISTYKRWVIA